MNEKMPEQESSIERKDKRVIINLGGKAVEFTLFASVLYSYPEPYDIMDHVFRKREPGDDAPNYFYKRDYPDIYEELDNAGFVSLRSPYPSPADEKVFNSYWENVVETDIQEWMEGEE